MLSYLKNAIEDDKQIIEVHSFNHYKLWFMIILYINVKIEPLFRKAIRIIFSLHFNIPNKIVYIVFMNLKLKFIVHNIVSRRK